MYSRSRYEQYFTGIALCFVLALLSACSTTIDATGSPTMPTAGNPSSLPSACVVYAQPNFTTSMRRATGQNTLANPGSLIVDSAGTVYVADYDNSRVLHFPALSTAGVGSQADQVYGQPDYTSNGLLIGQAGLNHPHGIALDPNGGLYISDMLNDRILHYIKGSTGADIVYGQPDFNSHGNNTGGLSAHSLYHPQGLAIDSTGLYVADSSNNRVLHFPMGSMIADMVYGQGTPGNSPESFTRNDSGNGATGLNNPRDVAVDSTGLYVVDAGNHRIVHYTPGNPTADRVYGQPDFASTSVQPNQGQSQPTATTLNNPTGVTLDTTSGLYVADRNNNRILYFAPPTSTSVNDPSAMRVYSQPGYTTSRSSTTASTFNGPGDVAVDAGGSVYVLDIFNQRILKFGCTASAHQIGSVAAPA